MPAQSMNLNFLTNPTQRVATGKRLPTAELETLLLFGTPAARLKVLKKASPNAHVLAANPNTYHLMEGLVRVSDPAYLAELLFAIRRHISALAQSRYGNVVIQEVLKKVPTVVKNDLAVSLIEQAYPISCGEFGNRVIQVLFDDATCATKLYTALMPQFTGLITSEYGQIVVAHCLSISNDDAEKCPFWNPIINSTRSMMTALWNENCHQVILQIIKRVSDPSRCSGSGDRLWRLVNKILVEELIIGETLKGYLPSQQKKQKTNNTNKKEKSEKEKELDKLLELDEEEEEEDDQQQQDDPREPKMTREERDTFVSERSSIINALLSCGVDQWRDKIVSCLLEVHEFEVAEASAKNDESATTSPKKQSQTKKNNKKNNNEDAAQQADDDKEKEEEETTTNNNKPLLLSWTHKQSLCSIIECLLRVAATSGNSSFKQQILTVFNKSMLSSSSLSDMIGHRYAATVARELVKHGDIYLGAQSVKTIASVVNQAGTLVKQPSFSSFFQALAQSSQKHADALTQILLTSDGKILKERDSKKANQDEATTTTEEDDDKKKKKNKRSSSTSSNKKGGNSKKQKNEDAAVEQEEHEQQEEEEDLDAGNTSLLLAETAVDHPSASHLLQLLLGLNPQEQQISADKHAALVTLVYNRVSNHPLAFSRFATSPHGSHVIQALLKCLSDDQIKHIVTLTPKARVQGKFFGVSALARNKYSCHTIIVLLQELKKRKVALEAQSNDNKNKKKEEDDMMEHLRIIMNALKPHVHFLALSAASGRKVFETMCQVGSDKLRRMMSDVVALKCEAYLKGDPYIEGDKDHDGTKSSQNRVRAQSGAAHPFKAKHDAKRRPRSNSSPANKKK